ncbi:hypothetical protein ACWCPM_06025 [Streptomyces sp. NPDC002309]
MTPTLAVRPVYLPSSAPVDVATVDGSWNAVTMPCDWGSLVWDVVAERSGPVMEDLIDNQLLWVIPPGGADCWPGRHSRGRAGPP